MLVSAIGKFNKNITVQNAFKSMPKEKAIPKTEGKSTATKLDLIA